MKYAVVTGSTKGIGLSIAANLIREGYFVFINARNQCSVNLPKNNYLFIEADMSCEEGIDNLFASIVQITEKIDCLVLNTGATCRKKFCELSYSDWKTAMDTNIVMPALLVKKFLPYISEDGNILFIGSMLGIKPHARSLPYGVSKAGVHALVQGLVKETAERKIRVNGVAPGFVSTDWQNEKPDWLREKIEAKIALKRFAEAEEIADLCMKIIGNTYINGSVVSIDGGYDME